MYWVYFRNVIITREMRRTPLSWEGSTFSQPLWKPTRDATEIPQTEAQKRMRPQVATGSQAEMSFLIVCNKLAFCILNKWLKMFAHQKTNRCSISFSALHLKKKKKKVNVLLLFRLWHADIIITMPVHPRKVLEPSVRAGLWIPGPHSFTPYGLKSSFTLVVRPCPLLWSPRLQEAAVSSCPSASPCLCFL